MVEIGTDPAAGDGIHLWWTNRRAIRVVAIVVAVAAAALWMSVGCGDRNLCSRSGIAAMTLTALLAVMLPLALRSGRASSRTADDGVRIAAVAAAAILVIGTTALADHYAVAARFADGTRGTVDVLIVECQRTCLWSGIFWVRQSPQGNWIIKRDYVTLTTDGPGRRLNRRYIPAIDVGDPSQVYPLGGGSQWTQVKTIAVAVSAAVCPLVAAVLLLRYRRSRRYRRHERNVR